jgi:tetratricopeptide (TPR) repeat protein
VPHYRAFVSYSHLDSRIGRDLQRRLERYRMPRKLIGQAGRYGPVPARLTPIFRDRDELPAAADLTREVRAALAASACLIVVCSPNSARSHWVAREIALFREIDPLRPILAVLIDGEPATAFPPGLAGEGLEPVAADLRAGADGRRLGLLKIVAGMTGIGLDALVQRDAQRRMRAVTAVTLVALAAVLAMAMLTAAALSARREAERQRAEAEGLVEFMLTELRQELKSVGRLDVLGRVNARALDYYAGQPPESLAPASLERRARILHAMGEDDEKRGRLDLALVKFRAAHRATAALLARAPDDPDRIFGHAQSEFWIGYADYQRGRFAAAAPAFRAYKALADRLVAIAPDRADYRRESGYAEGNLCSLALVPPVDPPAALRACAAALAQMEAAARRMPKAERAGIAADIANRHAWLGEAHRASGAMEAARREFRAQEAILTRLIAADPDNLELRDTWLTVQFSFSERAAAEGRIGEARRRLERARGVAERMIAFDPANDLWVRRRQRILEDIVRLSKAEGEES